VTLIERLGEQAASLLKSARASAKARTDEADEHAERVVSEGDEMAILLRSREVIRNSNSPFDVFTAQKYLCGYSDDTDEVTDSIYSYMQDVENPTQNNVHKNFYLLLQAATANKHLPDVDRIRIGGLFTNDMVQPGKNTIPHDVLVYFLSDQSCLITEYWGKTSNSLDRYVDMTDRDNAEVDNDAVDEVQAALDDCITLLRQNIKRLESIAGESRFVAQASCHLTGIYIYEGNVELAENQLAHAILHAEKGESSLAARTKIRELTQDLKELKEFNEEIGDDESWS